MGEKVTWEKSVFWLCVKVCLLQMHCNVLVPQNVTEKYKSEMLPGAPKPSG